MVYKDYLRYRVECSDDGIAVLTANRPEKHNAMDSVAWKELDDFFAWADEAPEVRVVVLTGAGKTAFIAGADLNDLAKRGAADCLLSNMAQRALRRIEDCAKPVIAAVNGYAFGGGCETAIACDIRIVSENAVFALPETGLGILPGAGGTQRLTRLIGLGRAKDMVLLGRKVRGHEAVQIGLATLCVPQEQLLSEAMGMARQLLKRGPLAIQVSKRVLQASLSAGEEVGLLLESLALSALCGTEDMREGATSFLEKRRPCYKRR